MEVKEIEFKSIQYRRMILAMIMKAKAGHTGGSLSCVDMINVLYNHVMIIDPKDMSNPNRDRFILSKGHSVEALYAVLADLGFFPVADLLNEIEQYQSIYSGHPTRKVNGIEQNTGALGHGLPFAVGQALAAKMDHRPYRVFVLTGDGELTEGSNWEASMSAAHYHLDNLTVIVDRNHLQISGKTENVMASEPLEAKFNAFGYQVTTVNGNSIRDLMDVFNRIPFQKGKPNLIIAETVKGKGFSVAENNPAWHHHVPSAVEYQQALSELDHAEKELQEKYAGF